MENDIIDEIRKVRCVLDKMIKKNPQKFKDEIKQIEKENSSRLVLGKPRYKKTKAA